MQLLHECWRVGKLDGGWAGCHAAAAEGLQAGSVNGCASPPIIAASIALAQLVAARECAGLHVHSCVCRADAYML
jgi:hypothetical protein